MRTFRIIGVVGASALLLSASVAFAEDAPKPTNIVPRVEVTQTAKNRVQDIRAEVKARAEAVREEAKSLMEKKREEAKTVLEARREEVKTLMETKREETKATIEARREEVKTLMETKREEAKTVLEARREEAKSLMETKREEAKVRIETQREKAVQRLEDLQDKVKQETAQRLTEKFENLNTTWTDHFMRLLDRYDEIVQKMQDRTDIAVSAGKDVAAATMAIESARVAIEDARAAIIAQASKTYTLDVTTVTVSSATTTPEGQSELMQGLRDAFKNTHTILFQDLYALRDGPMKDARAAVQNALQTLSSIPKVDDDSGESTTATTTSNQ